MDYLNIIEEEFTHSDYVAYLRGSLLKWLLEDKPLDMLQFKLYADKLVDALEEERMDEQDYKTDVYRPTVDDMPIVDPDEPRVYKFKLGDRCHVKNQIWLS